MLRRVTVFFLALVLTLGVATCAWAAGPKIVVDGVELWSDVAPFQTGGRTMVPLRVISENLYATVDWNPAAKKVTVVQDGKTVVLTLGSKQALVNGETRLLDAAATTRNGRTFVPLRFVSETLGCEVDYKSGVVSVVSPDDGSMAYLLDASEAYLNLQSVKFAGNLKGTIKVSGSGSSRSENMVVNMSGWFQNPDKVYMEMDMAMADQSQVMKMYIDGAKMYVREGNGSWTAMDGPAMQLPGANMQNPALFAQSPEQVAELVKKLGIRTRFAPDETINGQECRIVVYQMNREQFLNAMVVLMREFAAADQQMSEMMGNVDEMMQFMRAMVQKLTMQVKIYIAKDSALLVREGINMQVVMGDALLGGDIQMNMDGTIDFKDYDGQITPPDVSRAVAKTGGQ